MQLELIRNRAVAAEAPDDFRLLFIHGAGCGAWVWQNLLDWFAERGVGAAALSLRGHGGSEGAARLHRYRIADYVADVAATIARMPAPPVVVGHSMGGLVVQKLLERSTVPGAILLAASPVGGMLRDGFRMLRHWPGRFARALLGRSLLTLYSTEASARWFLFTQATDAALIAATRRNMQDESWRAILDMAGLDRPLARRSQVPMLVLAGAEDHMVSVGSNRRTAGAWGAEFRIIETCGHMLPIDSAWPGVAGVMQEWLRSLQSSAPQL